MNMQALRSRYATDEERRPLAAFILRAALAGRALPPHIPGEPSGLVAKQVAEVIGPDLLEALAVIYDVKTWTPEEYERVFIRGALAGWRPETIVLSEPGRFRVIAPNCPLASETRRDPRTCQACRAIQEEATRLALPGQVENAGFRQVIAQGDRVCEFDVELRR